MRLPRSVTRRESLRWLGAAGVGPFVTSGFAAAPPSGRLRHVNLGSAGVAGSDIRNITSVPNVDLVAVAEVDLPRAETIRKQFPNVRVYQDWRELLDKERDVDTVAVSTPDHMHAVMTAAALARGKHVYCQKPLTQSVAEARRIPEFARGKSLVTQMGIQNHSHENHRSLVQLIQSGVIGRVTEAHSWSHKKWGDPTPRPQRSDPVPPGFAWGLWLGGAAERPYVGDKYYHPANWRKRLDFGTGTFGDMGCHILDPVYTALALSAPKTIRSEGAAPNADSWATDAVVRFTFPGTKFAVDGVTVTWYDGDRRPPEEVRAKLGGRAFAEQGSVFVGTDGVLYSEYAKPPVLLPEDKFRRHAVPTLAKVNHWVQFVNACRGEGRVSAPFEFAGPLTETVLLGCLATRFPGETLEWDATALRVTNVPAANQFVARQYRRGWDLGAV